MKTTILTIALVLASALSALAQTVMRENSTVYFKTNVYLHDDPTNALHTRISVEGMEPLWVAASNQVVYYLGGEFTNGNFHALNAVIENLSITGESMTLARDVKARNALSVDAYGFAAGAGTSAGFAGFAAGTGARGAYGSFVFADNSAGGDFFNRTNHPNGFSARAAGGVYFDTPMMVVTGTVSAGSFVAAAGLTATQGVSQIILPTATNGLVSGTLWNDAGTVKVMP